MTALGAARGDDAATTFGAHADEEAVGTLAANNRGLIGAFHGYALDFDAKINVQLDIVRAFMSRPIYFRACG